MNQRQIQIVLSVAKHLSFSEAAWETSYAASVISKQVASVEKKLGVRLFERKARSKVEMTAIGSELLPHLKKIQNEYDMMEKLIRELSEQKTLTMACSRAFTTLGEDELIATFCSQYQNVRVRQLESRMTDCIDLVESKNADFSILLLSDDQLDKFRSSHKKLDFVLLAKNQVGVLLRSNHPSIHDGKINLKDLSDELFLLRSVEGKGDGEMRTELFLNACRSEGFEPKIEFQSDMRRTAAFSLVAKGYCVIPVMYALHHQYPGTSFLHFTKEYYSFNVVLLYCKDNLSSDARNFIQCAKKNAKIFSDIYFEGEA